MPNISPNMNLVVPIPNTGVTGTGDTGPLYAQNISNDLLVIVDSHDHSFGKGVQINPAGLNINSDLTINANNLNQIRSTRFASQGSTLSGVGDIANLYVVAGNLWYNNSAGSAIQMTSGGAISTASTNAILIYQSASANWTILNTDTYVLLDVTTGGTSITVTLPAANSVTAGRWYVIADANGAAATHNIIIATAGADTIQGASSININVNYGTVIIASNGNNKWDTFTGIQGVQGATGTIVGSVSVATTTWLGYSGADVKNFLITTNTTTIPGSATANMFYYTVPDTQIADVFVTVLGTANQGPSCVYKCDVNATFCGGVPGAVGPGIVIGSSTTTNTRFPLAASGFNAALQSVGSGFALYVSTPTSPASGYTGSISWSAMIQVNELL